MTKISEGRAIRENFSANGLLAATEADLYTCPALCQAEIDTLICVNPSGGSTNVVSLYVQPSGGTSRLIAEESVLAGGKLIGMGEAMKLNEGDKIRGFGTNADQVRWFISGVKEYSV